MQKGHSTYEVRCINCKKEIKMYWEPRYNGYRGRCASCHTNWPEE